MTVTELIEKLQDKYDKKVEESGENDPEAAQLWTKLNFMKELSDFMDVQTARFIEIKNAVNVQKDNIQKMFDAKMSAPRYIDVLKTYLPVLGGAAVASTVLFAGIWNLCVSRVQGWLPHIKPEYVKDMVNFLGLVALGSWVYIQNYLGRRKKEKLASKCAAKKEELDVKERGIKESILRLVVIEYDRLSNEYGYVSEAFDVANASARADIVRKEAQVKYGVDLPYPIFDSTRAEATPAPNGKIRTFISAVGDAIKGLTSRNARQEASADIQQPGPQ